MARHPDLEVVDPDPPEDGEGGGSLPPHALRPRPRGRPRRVPFRGSTQVRWLVVGLVVAALAAGLLAAGLIVHHRSRPAGPAPVESDCELVSARHVATALGVSRATATLAPTGVCTWTSPVPGRTALLEVQVYDSPVEARAALRNEQAQIRNADSWTFRDGAFTAASGPHATAVALVGDATVVADANGLPSAADGMAAARTIVAAAAAQVGHVSISRSTLPLP